MPEAPATRNRRIEGGFDANLDFPFDDAGWGRAPRRSIPPSRAMSISHASTLAEQCLCRCCTTSYFAPSILLAREGLNLESFFNAFPVAAWQGQIDAVIGGSIDATMVYEDVWLAMPDNARRTRVLARLDDLAAPAFIVRSDFDAGIADHLKHALLGLPAEGGPNVLYAGFADYQDARMERLFADLARLPGRAHAA